MNRIKFNDLHFPICSSSGEDMVLLATVAERAIESNNLMALENNQQNSVKGTYLLLIMFHMPV